MGNYRFKLSEMIPNAWFYKLKDLSTNKTTKSHKTPPKQNSSFPPNSQHHHHHHHHVRKTEHLGDSHPNLSDPRKSYYISRKFISKPDSKDPERILPDPPRKSSRKKPTKTNSTSTKSSSSSVFSSNHSSSTSEYRSSATLRPSMPVPEASPNLIKPQFRNEIPLPSKNRLPCSASCRCRLDQQANPEYDVVVAVDEKSLARNREISNGFDLNFGTELPPIIAKSEKFKKIITSAIDGNKEQQSGSSMRRLSSSSPGGNGVRLRVNSPRIMGSIGGGRRGITGSRRRKNKAESFAIVKSSFDPRRDFKESMVEMILENDIKGSKELEELLACYLELNSDEYHDMIVKVFEQIWFDLNGNNNANKHSKWKLLKD